MKNGLSCAIKPVLAALYIGVVVLCCALMVYNYSTGGEFRLWFVLTAVLTIGLSVYSAKR